MSQKDNILEELKELNSSLPSQPGNIYQVPAGYFDELTNQVLAKIRAMEVSDSSEELEILSPFLAKISRKMPYQVPTGYFEEIDTHFVTIDSNKELESISPLLGSLKKEMPYSVPAGYFENINTSLDNRENNKPAKLVALNPRKTWMRYAAAAVVTGLIVVLSGYFFGGHKDEGMRVMAKLTRDVKKMNETQKDNLLDFMKTGMSGNEVAQVTSADNKSTIKTLIQGISDEELKDFKEQTEDIEDVLMTN